MAKKKEVSVEDKEVKDPSTGVVMFITNNQRCAWLAPPLLLGKKGFSTKSLVHPMRGIEVDKGRFDFEMKHSKAFRFMVETGLLKADKKIVKLDERDLQNAEGAKAPPELTGVSSVKDEGLKVLNQAVTIDVKHQASKK